MIHQQIEELKLELAELRVKYNELKRMHAYQINQLISQLTQKAVSEPKKATNDLREVTVYFDNGDSINTSMAKHLTDDDIRNYYAIGRLFNVGNNGNDCMAKIISVRILN